MYAVINVKLNNDFYGTFMCALKKTMLFFFWGLVIPVVVMEECCWLFEEKIDVLFTFKWAFPLPKKFTKVDQLRITNVDVVQDA